MKCTYEKSGFTVLELIVALSIASLSLAAIYSAIYTHLETARRLDQKLDAIFLARQLLSDPHVISGFRSKKRISGTSSSFKWEMEATTIPFPRHFQNKIGWPKFSLIRVHIYSSDSLLFDLAKIVEVN